MAWNEPGKNSDNNPDPWGGRRDQKPPDLDKMLAELLRKFRLFFSSKKGSMNWQPAGPNGFGLGYGVGLIAAFLLAVWFISGFFIINPAEETVILRFGKYADVLHPGLHWFARFIDSKYTVDVQKIYSFSLQGNFLTKSSDQNDLPTQIVPVDLGGKTAGSMDQSKNMVNVELNVQYRINDPRAYLFNVVNPDDTIQQVAAGALSDVIGTMKLDDALTTGREFLSSGVLERAKKVLTNYHAGLEVVAVTLKKVQAPDEVREAFNDVNRADQDKATYIQQAEAYASKVVPIAQGAAARILADATGYQQQVVLGAQANVAKYQAILRAYMGSPDITRERLYLESMETVLSHSTKVLVDANVNNLMYLPLDKLVQRNAPIAGEIKNGSN